MKWLRVLILCFMILSLPSCGSEEDALDSNDTTFDSTVAAPKRPRPIKPPRVVTGTATLEWTLNDPIEEVTSYNIYRTTIPGSYVKGSPLASVDGSTSTYIENTGFKGNTYCFVITAVNVVDESEFSNEGCKLY